MYDDLVKRLRSVKDGWQTEEESWMLQAADAIEELSKPKWIPVTERLPESEKYVLAYSADDDFMDVEARHKFEAFQITHWMPLPEPPKEET